MLRPERSLGIGTRTRSPVCLLKVLHGVPVLGTRVEEKLRLEEPEPLVVGGELAHASIRCDFVAPKRCLLFLFLIFEMHLSVIFCCANKSMAPTCWEKGLER